MELSGEAYEKFDFRVYPVEIRERNGLFYLICRTFNIVVSDSSLEQAFSKIISKRETISQQLSSFGVKVNLCDEYYQKCRTQTALQKWMQISIIFMCLGLPLGLLSGTALIASKASSIIRASKNSMKHTVGNLVSDPAQLTAMLNSVTSKLDNVTPERKEEIQLEIRKIVTFMKPFVTEIQELSDAR